MARNQTRCQRDYEDLDNAGATTSTGSKENPATRTNDFLSGRRSGIFLSDTALDVARKSIEESKNLAEQYCGGRPSDSIYTLNLTKSTSLPLSACYLNTITFSGETFGMIQEKPSYWRKETLWLLCYVLIYGTYLVLGSLCFQTLETSVEEDQRKEFLTKQENFLQKYPEIKATDLENFLKTVISAHKSGIFVLQNSTDDVNWHFGQAFLFSTSLVTTVGYGHVTPKTEMGKIFCIIYASLGIPLTLILLSTMVERLLMTTNFLLRVFINKLGQAYQIFNIRLIHLGVIASSVIVIFFIIPSWIFTAYLEPNWSFLEAFYFCFISLTTIGLGDLTPHTIENPIGDSIYKTVVAIYLVIGIIAMMLLLTVFYDIPQLNIGLMLRETHKPTAWKKKSNQTNGVVEFHNEELSGTYQNKEENYGKMW